MTRRDAAGALRMIVDAGPPGFFVGTRETGINPNTVDALERGGWIVVLWEKGRRRRVFRLTDEGWRVLAEASS